MSFISKSSPKISVVVPCLNEAHYLRNTVKQLQATLPARSEIVVIDDGSTDGSTDFLATATDGIKLLSTPGLGPAGTRNHGATETTGDVIVFADAHVDTPQGWWEPIVATLDNPRVGVAAPAISAMGHPESKGFGMQWTGPNLGVEWLGQRGRSSYAVPLLCGCFLAMRRDTFETTGGFDRGMVGYGSEDIELSLRFWLLGYEVWVVPQVTIAHLFREKHPYAVKWTPFLHNMLRMAFAHFSSDRLARVIESVKGYQDFAAAVAMNVENNVWTQRATLATSRVRSDDWFFSLFEIAC